MNSLTCHVFFTSLLDILALSVFILAGLFLGVDLEDLGTVFL